MALTLTREDGGTDCAKCKALVSRGEAKGAHPAVYTLRQDRAVFWRLCTSHAAAAASVHGLQFPPVPCST